jgi:hypothetical protein
MDDLEITRRCAEAMGIEVFVDAFGDLCVENGDIGADNYFYSPLTDDAQCFALVKKFRLLVDGGNAGAWCVHSDVVGSGKINENLNRAICECVANMKGK